MPASVYELLDRRSAFPPALPDGLARLVDRCGDSEIDAAGLAAVIDAQPEIASRLIRLAGSTGAVSSTSEAIAVIGLGAVRALGLCVGIYTILEPREGGWRNKETELLWQHSIAVALCAREIARRIGLREREWGFAAGLLHDVGQVVLLQGLPDLYPPLLQSPPDVGATLEDAERDVLGADHAQVGARLLRLWHAPDDLCVAVEQHHDGGRLAAAPGGATLSSMIQVADWLATAHGLGAPGGYGRRRPSSVARAAIGIGDEALGQLSLGLDRRVSRVCETLGLRPVSPDVFQKALFGANRALSEMLADLDQHSRSLQHSQTALPLVQAVTTTLLGADDTDPVLHGACRALAKHADVEPAMCTVPLGPEQVLVASAGAGGGTAGCLSAAESASDRQEWECRRPGSAPGMSVVEVAFPTPGGGEGLLSSELRGREGVEAPQLDRSPLVPVLEAAPKRAGPGHSQLAGDRRPSPATISDDDDSPGVDQRLRLLGELTAGAAHDLNNALVVLLGQAQLALMAEDQAEVRQHLLTIERTVNDCATTVRRLQEFARGARTQLKGEIFDLATIARDTVDVTRPRWRDEAQRRGASIKVVTDFADELPVKGSPAALREALTNLIFNAVDAMPTQGTLSIRAWREGREARLSVRDTGTGMSAEVLGRLFRPFFSTKGDRGTGLGLSICKRIVEEHGGRIEVSSRLGAGSTFVVSLPLAGDAPPTKREEATQMVGRPLSVLVIDDEPQVREVLLRMLGLDGHTAVAAADAREGLAAFAKQRFDIVLTDLGLPDSPGWVVVRGVKEANPRLPVVLITGWSEGGDCPEEQGGADAVLTKPFGIAELRRVIEAAVPSGSR